MDILFEAGWIQPRGRRRTPGRPSTWCTTPDFLDHFGLADLDDLPGVDELKAAGLLDSGPIPGVLVRAIPGADDALPDPVEEPDRTAVEPLANAED